MKPMKQGPLRLANPETTIGSLAVARQTREGPLRLANPWKESIQ